MRKLGLALCVILILGVGAPVASAATISLNEIAFNLDGALTDIFYYDPFIFPAAIDASGFDTTTGLGTIIATISGMGNHTVIAFFDHEIDEATNTFFNEHGSFAGAPAAGQSWEIDEPGYVYGDIFGNVVNNTLDNSNGVPGTAPDDVSMAIGWNFYIPDNVSVATITFNLSMSPPPPGFYLIQSDPDSQASVFLSSSMQIQGQNPIPEPGTIVLLLSGLGVIGLAAKFRKSA
jgi:hypothetical protein